MKAVQKRCQGEIGKEFGATSVQKSGEGKKVRANEASSADRREAAEGSRKLLGRLDS